MMKHVGLAVRADPRQVISSNRQVCGAGLFQAGFARRNGMAKGQLRGNKEAKKPKKDNKPVNAPIGTFIAMPKAVPSQKQKS
jgi:hypothetical protein